MKEQDAQHVQHLLDLQDLRLRLPNTAFSMSNKDHRFMQMAIYEAINSPILMRHGCIAVINGKIIARGFNTDRCHSRDGLLNQSWCCHAEIDVLRKVIRMLSGTPTTRISSLHDTQHLPDLSKITLYIARAPPRLTCDTVMETGNVMPFKSSAPCTRCATIIRTLRIKHIAFVASNNEFIKCRPCDYNISHITKGHRIVSRRNILRDNIVNI
jgi:tRNA(Arg) A34 adenosine deaminase TadA